MSLLSVIEGNPRRRRRRGAKRRRSTSHRKTTRRRRSSARRAAVSNPRRRRRRSNARRHVRRHARRRHRNPAFGGSLVNTLMKGATLGLGAIAANAATAAANHFAFNGTMAGPAKLGLKAGVGIAGYFGLKALKQGSLANAFLVGAGIAVALEAYDQFVKPTVAASVPWLADYDYGSLSGWAPQPGVGNWAPQGALGAYASGSLQGDGDAYANGAYN